MRCPLPLLLATVFVLPVAAQDVAFIRALEAAQAAQPAALTSTGRIAAEREPGTPLVIHGQLFREDGRTAVPDAIVFAYHTDREGLYDRPGSAPHAWRLRGWVRTDSDGRFEFHTIRPGAYPSRNQAAHVHFTVFTADARFHAGALEFDDDPLIGARDRARPNAVGEFGTIRPVRRMAGVEHVDFRIRLDPRQRF